MKHFFFLSLLLILCNCATGIKGTMGGMEQSKIKSKIEQKKMTTDFLSNLKVGETTIKQVENILGFPTQILNMKDNREIWIFEVTTGNWFIFIGSANLKQHIFEFKDDILSNYYIKTIGSKSGILYPTIISEPIM